MRHSDTSGNRTLNARTTDEHANHWANEEGRQERPILEASVLVGVLITSQYEPRYFEHGAQKFHFPHKTIFISSIVCTSKKKTVFTRKVYIRNQTR